MDIVNKPLEIGNEVTKDLTSGKFYKNPLFYSFTGYLLLLIAAKVFINKDTFNRYVFGENDKLSFGDLFTYPYGLDTPQNIIKTFISNPIIVYLSLFTLFLQAFVDINSNGRKVYFYASMVSLIMIVFILLVHVAVVRLIIKPETIQVSDKFPGKKNNNTYADLYRGHWITLFIISPLYAFIVVYAFRKLG